MLGRMRRVTYLVSGEENIRPSHRILRQAKRRVLYDDQVSEHAANELIPGQSFIVIAHGSGNGTITWFSSARGSADPWLWVGMQAPPQGCHLYLYACKAGKKLVPFLDQCEVLGHADVVPMPLDSYKLAVMGFLAKAHQLIANPKKKPGEWAKELMHYVNQTLIAESNAPNGGSWETVATMLMLRKSMNYADF